MNGLDRLWAPWRGEYVKGLRGGEEEGGCLFCQLQKLDDQEALILARSEHSFAVLNRYPYNSGHLMVAPRRHIGELGDVKDDENLDMQRLLQRCTRGLKEVMEPDGFNLGMNLGRVAGAGVPDHLHWHVVPRWNGDTNFMPLVAETKVMPENLDATRHRLATALATDG